MTIPPARGGGTELGLQIPGRLTSLLFYPETERPLLRHQRPPANALVAGGLTEQAVCSILDHSYKSRAYRRSA